MFESSVTTIDAAAVEALDELLQASLAAKESYDIAIRGVEARHDQASIALRVLESDHTENVHKVQKMVLAAGGTPTVTSGRPMTRVVEGVVSMLGDNATIRSLEPVERRCLNAARRAAEEVDGDAKALLIDSIIPRLQKHAQLVGTLIENA